MSRIPLIRFSMLTFSFAGCELTSAVEIIETAYEPNQQSTVAPLLEHEESLPEFIDGTSLVVKPRSYYLNRNRDENPDNKGWALGGALEYHSGWLARRFQLGATLYTSQKLYGPEDRDGTLLFKPGPEQITVLGEANLTWRFSQNVGARIGRQRFELPYLGSHDIRMVPNTFEAVAIGNTSATGLAYMAGYVDRIKVKNADEFISMSEAAGAQDSDEGVIFAGTRFVMEQGSLIAGIYQRTFEVFDTFFAKVEHPFELNDGSSLKAFLQFTQQSSNGDELIGSFDTNMVAGKLEWRRGDTTYRVGASSTDDESGIQKPYGNPANYLSVIVDDFDRAGEDAWMLGINHDFKRVGPGDLSLFANIVQGDTPDDGPNASPDETEYDLTVDYKLKEGWSERVWVRVRGAFVDQQEDQGGDDFFDFRIIVNYDFELI